MTDQSVALETATQLGVAGRAVAVHPPVVRQLTHRELVMTAVELVAENDVGDGDAVWIERERVAGLGLPAAFLAVANQIGLDPC